MAQIPSDAIRHYFQTAAAHESFRIFPSYTAHKLNAPLRPVLEALVQGLFQAETIMHWELRCPACGGYNEEADWLSNAQHDYTCQHCGGTFTVHLDDEAQVTFSPHPTLQIVDRRELEQERESIRAIREEFPPTPVHELMTIQIFRDWARNETLPANEYLEVRHMAVWFSDLTGSTALYARQGDPVAYSLVREHFGLVFGVLNRNGGAVVKTIGDAVMGVFVEPAAALQAALDCHDAIAGFTRRMPPGQTLSLKIGVHAGPAIVVTLNEQLDYFGTTVNIAARIEQLARGKETIFTDVVYGAPGVQDIASAYDLEVFQANIRGLDRMMQIYRLVM